jgi:hypothetical protein
MIGVTGVGLGVLVVIACSTVRMAGTRRRRRVLRK